MGEKFKTLLSLVGIRSEVARPIASVMAVSGSFAIVAVVAAIWLYRAFPRKQPEMSVELFRACLQFSFIGVIGATISELYRRTQAERDRKRHVWDLSAEACKDYMYRLGSAYRGGKAVRRSLKALGLKTPGVGLQDKEEVFKCYETEMKQLNKIQLELEALKIEAGARPEFAGIGLESNLSRWGIYFTQVTTISCGLPIRLQRST